MDKTSTQRFSDRVADYIRFRPGYPDALLMFMRSELGLNSTQVIADIGSGTGKLTELLLRNHGLVYAVEPNGPMREAAEVLLGADPNFRSTNGTAEQTNLPDACADFITVAQAFHWFDQQAFRRECDRLLRPGGRVLLIWNNRLDEHSAFMTAYEAFLQEYSIDYSEIDLRRINHEHFDIFFGPGGYGTQFFDYEQVFDFEGIWGRYQSCSYALPAGHPEYEAARNQLKILFDQSEQSGQVRVYYQTEVYYSLFPTEAPV